MEGLLGEKGRGRKVTKKRAEKRDGEGERLAPGDMNGRKKEVGERRERERM